MGFATYVGISRYVANYIFYGTSIAYIFVLMITNPLVKVPIEHVLSARNHGVVHVYARRL